MPDIRTRVLLKQVRAILGLRSTRLPKALLSWWGALREQRVHRFVPARYALASEAEFLAWRNPVAPEVSVVVPVFNQIGTALECLRAVVGAANDPGALELIVVDDASTDVEVERLRAHRGIAYHRNSTNLGFVGSSNIGARLARGRCLVFLNSDTLVTPGWLEPLMARLGEPDIGIVGSSLQYPDGRLQEAGGLVFSDASGWNYGRDGHPDDPRYLTFRDTHYCSGAALALSRERFERMGGFDSLFAPGYYEDTDLAMRVRATGARVVYEPESVVLHMEGVSAGTDGRSGMKAAQAVNRHKFLERWRDTLRQGHPPAGMDADLVIRKAGPGWIVAYPGPEPHEEFLLVVETLVRKGCAVDLFLHAELPPARIGQLRGRGVHVWTPAWRATGRWLLLRHGSAVHVALVDGASVFREWLRQARVDLPLAQQLALVPTGASIPDDAEGAPAIVAGADEVLARIGR